MASTFKADIPGAILERGFWLYVWSVETPAGIVLYIGRTGDNSSPHATAPFTRMGQHLGNLANQNALRRHLTERGIDPRECERFTLISHGPLFPEVAKAVGDDRSSLMARHLPIRDVVGALERNLAEALAGAGYKVLNRVSWRHKAPEALWNSVRDAFSEHFPRLKTEPEPT